MSSPGQTGASKHAGWQLGIAATGVMLGAADTYVVVIALTAMMASLGISITNLNQATPIISGYLIGYVAMLPLLGRLSDVRGRRSIYLWCLLAFAVGSLLTATAPQLPQLVIGRTLQGAGAGGLVPVTLAMVADHWPIERRNLPLGVVAGVQELGSMLGPLYGAAILALASWRLIFWINLPLAALLALGLSLTGRHPRAAARRHDPTSLALLLLLTVAVGLLVTAPAALTNSDSLGVLYSPWIGGSQATTPLAAAASLLALLLVARQTLGPAAMPRLLSRDGVNHLTRSDWRGALLLLATLALLVMCFATADPTSETLSGSWPILLPLAILCLLAFVWQERHHNDPLIHLAALAQRVSLGCLLANLCIGAALVTALVDVPLFARTVSFQTETADQAQLGAALLLLRLLIAIPVGALLGGVLCSRIGHRLTVVAAMLLCVAGFALMAQWRLNSTTQALAGIGWLHPSDIALVITGLGFGLAIAPVNAAMLAAADSSAHGLAASLVVMARMVGMLVGLSLLTAIGLHHFYSSVNGLCTDVFTCPNTVIITAVTDEIHTIFWGAAGCALLAGLIGGACLRGRTRQSLGEVLSGL